MKNSKIIIILICCFLVNKTLLSQVKVWEDSITIPTWEIGPAEKHPAFPWTFVNRRPDKQIYPYPYKEILTNNKVAKTYRACWLENEFIKVLVMPEIGGKLYGAKDKTNGYNFFYWQPTVKPALIGMTGAWVSGGIEWNFPTGHRPSTFSPVSHRLTKNPDGSATVWIGETEWVYGMRWIVGITVHPGRSLIEAKVRLVNPTSLRHSYYMWATTATNTNENYQLIYPTRLMTDHGKFEFYNWPVDEEVNISWWKNVPNASSFFSMELGNFFGGYDHGKRAGTVLTGDKHIIIGKKFWTWGTSPSGRIWDWILSDGEGPYVEPQAGAYADNQPDYHWLEPGEIKSYSHIFYPVRDIGPFKNANVNGALNLEFNDEQINIGVYSTSILNPGIVSLMRKGKIVFEKKIKIDPSQPFSHQMNIQNALNNRQDFELILSDENEKELVSYSPKTFEKLSFSEPTKVYDDPKTIETTDKLWHIGEKYAKYREPFKARKFFKETIKRDPGNSRSHISLAELDIKRANYKSALEHLAIAEKRDPDNGKIFYLQAVTEEAHGNFEMAYRLYYRAVHFQEYMSLAYEHIMRIDIRNGNYQQGVDHINKAIENNALNPQLWTLKATALRLSGNFEEAEKAVNHALSLDPILTGAVYEKRLVFQMQGKSEQKSLQTLNQLLLDDYQSYIELAVQYIETGDFVDALDILQIAQSRGIKNLALIKYYEGYCHLEIGNTDNAAKSFYAAIDEPVDYIFPFRRKSIDVFHTALKMNPSDGKAHYYLGMIYAGITEGDKAIHHWKKAVELEPKNARVWRNLGLLLFDYPGVKSDTLMSRDYYKQAFKLAQDDSRILWEYDRVRQSLAEDSKDRLQLLQKYKKVVETRDDLLTAMLDLMVQYGQYKKALNYYLDFHFNNWEGRYSIHNSYMEACIGMAKSTNTPEKSIEFYLKACEYPKNLKVAPREPNLRGFLYYPMAQLYKKIGKISTADSLFKIASEESTAPPTLVNYFQSLALREKGHLGADRFLSQLQAEGQTLIDGTTGGYVEKSKEFKQSLGYYYLSKVHDARGEIKAAKINLNKAKALVPLIEREAIIFAQITYAQANQ